MIHKDVYAEAKKLIDIITEELNDMDDNMLTFALVTSAREQDQFGIAAASISVIKRYEKQNATQPTATNEPIPSGSFPA